MISFVFLILIWGCRFSLSGDRWRAVISWVVVVGCVCVRSLLV